MTSVFIKTYGCSLNHADSEAMAGIISKGNHELVETERDADLIVINSCVVKGHSQAQLFSYLHRMESLGKKVVVAGCGPQAMPVQLAGYSLVGTHQINRIGDAVDATVGGQTLIALQNEKIQRLAIPKIRRNTAIDIVPINNGCLGACTFCIVKKTRGSLESYPPREIVESIESAVREGIKEVWLTSPDTAVYGVDLRFSLPKLLRRVCDIEGDFQVRLGMGNPNWFIRYLEELPELFSNPKMFQFLHVPVQSGSDAVLEHMKRGYAVKDYVRIVEHMRNHLSKMTISTDVIVGFPGESNDQFQETMSVIEQTTPDVLNLSRFTPRPGTPAQCMPNPVPGKIKKERSTLMARLHESIAKERNKLWVGWRGRILIDEVGRHQTMIGRNYAYKPIVVQGNVPLGSIISIEVTESFAHYVKAFPIVESLGTSQAA